MVENKLKDEFIKDANPNKAQLIAIETIDKNVGVVAGAGTGKTKILTNRFINILLESEDPEETIEEILAITFTKKATAEMISRIENEIIKLSNLDENYKKLINKIPYLNISTIDAFCKNIVDENAIYLGIDPNYVIMDEKESEKILTEITTRILNENHDDTLDSFLENNEIILLDYIVQDIISAYRRIVSKGYKFDDLYNKLDLKNATEIDFNLYLENLNNYISLLIDDKVINGRFNLKKNYDREVYTKLLDENIDRLVILSNLLNDLKGLENKENIDLEKLNEICKDTEDCIFYIESNDVIYYEYFNRILNKIDREFTLFKRENGLFELSDLLFLTREVLDNESLLEIYQNAYKYIMIDEYQDTNRLQRDIFYRLASKNTKLDRNNFFVVGDKKQSIYGFRGSDVKVFDETLEDIKNSDGKIIKLRYNYRSSEEIIDYTNFVFNNLMGNGYDPIYSGVISKDNKEDVRVKFINLTTTELTEPEAICNQIIKLKSEGKNFGDISVLFRTTTKLYDLEKELNNYNIPYVNNKSKYFLEKTEIQDLILFLKFLNNPNDSLSLYGLLRSKIFSISDSDLYDISKRSDISLYEGLKKYSGEKINIIKSRDILEEMLFLKDKISLYKLFSKFINDTHYLEILSILMNNTQEIENVNTFREIICNFEKNNSSKVYDLLDYLVLSDLDDISEAKIFSNDSVNLMTIHGSKGLEFDTVILYDSESQKKSETNKIVFNSDLGYGIKTRNYSNYFKKIKENNSLLENEELDRVLYVCITRAKSDFIFLGHEYEKEKDNYASKLINIGYQYDNIKELEKLPSKPRREVELVSQPKQEPHNKIKISKDYSIGSFSSFKTFKNSKKEFYIKYILGLKDYNDSEDEVLNLNNTSNNSNIIEASKYGSLIHEIIENYNNGIELKVMSKSLADKYGLEYNLLLEEKIIKHINSYAKYNNIEGQKFHEFSFMLKLDEGYINGSIDELIKSDKNIYLTDFKTNYVSDINLLVDYYKTQIVLYSLAVNQILGSYPEKSYIHFLDIDKKVEIKVNEDDYLNLVKELNSFLRFIRLNDSIDSYV